MNKQLVIIPVVISMLLVVSVVIGDQQLMSYAKEHQVISQMNVAGIEGRAIMCQSFHLPWLARQFDFLTPLAFLTLVFLAGALMFSKRFGLSMIEKHVALSILVIGLTIMLIYQFIDPFYPFTMCRGLLL